MWIFFLSLVLWGLYLVFSYFFVNPAILTMLLPVYPRVEILLHWVEYGNNHRDLMSIVWLIIVVFLLILQWCLFLKKKEVEREKK